ncbi:MAG: hypothetical protein L3J53_07150 [Proteobacteria bacterium]|nr:hypothetical protein [Pseudomonadota bacterium]
MNSNINSKTNHQIDDDNGHLLFQIEQLQRQLQQEKFNTIEQNQALQANLGYLARDLDTLFASKTWSIGYGIMNVYRKIMNIFGNKHNGQYMNVDHFNNLIEGCEFYTHRKTRIHPTLTDTLDGKFPKNHYEASQVEVVLKDIWSAQATQKYAGHEQK